VASSAATPPYEGPKTKTGPMREVTTAASEDDATFDWLDR
jgi:hypothetical protein